MTYALLLHLSLYIITHRTSLVTNLLNLFRKFRQFLRNSLTNFFFEMCRQYERPFVKDSVTNIRQKIT